MALDGFLANDQLHGNFTVGAACLSCCRVYVAMPSGSFS